MNATDRAKCEAMLASLTESLDEAKVAAMALEAFGDPASAACAWATVREFQSRLDRLTARMLVAI